MPDIPPHAVQAVLDHPWADWPRSAHADHTYDASCAVCRGDVAAILAMLPAAGLAIVRADDPRAVTQETLGPLNARLTIAEAKVRDYEAALARVQELAERWRYTSDRKGGPHQELLAALGGPAVSEEQTGGGNG